MTETMARPLDDVVFVLGSSQSNTRIALVYWWLLKALTSEEIGVVGLAHVVFASPFVPHGVAMINENRRRQLTSGA
jgi:hypothetical protein